MKKFMRALLLCLLGLSVTGCPFTSDEPVSESRLVMFIGLDISGSFKNSKYYSDSLDFLSTYIFTHLKGHGGLKIPSSLFVGSIGGAKADEPKTFYPIQTFENKSVEEIRRELDRIFPAAVTNPFTDYNAFFYQVAEFVRNKSLIMKPISIVMLSDGIPDTPKKDGKLDFRSLDLKPLENLSRQLTVRVLYTDAVTGMNWQSQVPRQRVRVWTQDATVMTSWRDAKIFQPELDYAKKERFYAWIKDNVDFMARKRRVD